MFVLDIMKGLVDAPGAAHWYCIKKTSSAFRYKERYSGRVLRFTPNTKARHLSGRIGEGRCFVAFLEYEYRSTSLSVDVCNCLRMWDITNQCWMDV
jgi:hypothetical protein